MRSDPLATAFLHTTFVALVTACIPAPVVNPTPGAIESPVRVLALGDSYTIGEGVAPHERWPVQLAALLRERGLAVAEPMIIARTGWTTDELDVAITAAAPEGPFGLVTLLVGVNNQYRGRGAEEYRSHFSRLLRRAVDFAGGDHQRVLVLSIPDWGVTPFAEGRNRDRIAREIDEFNSVNREETLRAGARYVDVTPLSREARTDSRLLAQDGLHPSAAMYAGWAGLALPEALAALER